MNRFRTKARTATTMIGSRKADRAVLHGRLTRATRRFFLVNVHICLAKAMTRASVRCEAPMSPCDVSNKFAQRSDDLSPAAECEEFQHHPGSYKERKRTRRIYKDAETELRTTHVSLVGCGGAKLLVHALGACQHRQPLRKLRSVVGPHESP